MLESNVRYTSVGTEIRGTIQTRETLGQTVVEICIRFSNTLHVDKTNVLEKNMYLFPRLRPRSHFYNILPNNSE